MGTGASKEADGGSEGSKERVEDHQAGGQLYVSLKMENRKLTGDLVPHVYGSVPLFGSWDPSKAPLFRYAVASDVFESWFRPCTHPLVEFLSKPPYPDRLGFPMELPSTFNLIASPTEAT